MLVKLPHSGKMVLIDEILEYSSDSIKVRSVIKDDNAFLENDKFYTYKGIEMMAQSLGAFKGLNSSDDFSLGFLISIREFEIFKHELGIGDEVVVSSKVSMQDDNGFGVWQSSMRVKDELVASASLSVLSPSKEMFEGLKNE
ncbi:hypothetical protein LMG7974_00168 [Campylobacter majalis]|uniref:3-hydroxylacyl-ACP dehydratase n=1 Tax=Campylobacter majalis TaxID=2790656 RepID=A0ABM8Q2H3_9BACT|nr:thioester dehydrase [Campylobacter majalis]CAD7286956.1 hypothetical protein LMG7974_00168 [Campylobacter majalis]